MKTTPRSQLLLVELICDLVIFAVCAVVCVAVLVQARVMSRESTRLTQSVYIAQSAAETYLDGQPLPAGYDASGEPAQGPDPDYLVKVLPQADGTASVAVYPSGGSADEPVYTLIVKGGA